MPPGRQALRSRTRPKIQWEKKAACKSYTSDLLGSAFTFTANEIVTLLYFGNSWSIRLSNKQKQTNKNPWNYGIRKSKLERNFKFPPLSVFLGIWLILSPFPFPPTQCLISVHWILSSVVLPRRKGWDQALTFAAKLSVLALCFTCLSYYLQLMLWISFSLFVPKCCKYKPVFCNLTVTPSFTKQAPTHLSDLSAASKEKSIPDILYQFQHFVGTGRVEISSLWMSSIKFAFLLCRYKCRIIILTLREFNSSVHLSKEIK